MWSRGSRRNIVLVVKCEVPARDESPKKQVGNATSTWFDRHNRTIGIVLTLVTALAGVHEYLRYQWNGRVERSLGIYQRYQSGRVLDARIAIDRLWNSPNMWTELKKLHNAEGRFTYGQTSILARSAVRDRAIVDSLFVVWNTMSEASLCLAQKQCDQYTICKAFWADAQKVFYFFLPHFADRNVAWDETVQDPVGYTWKLLDKNCGSGEVICLFEGEDGFAQFKRYVYETFNVREDAETSCVPNDSNPQY